MSVSATRLGELPLCAGLAPAALAALARLATPMNLDAGASLIRQGRQADAGFALLDGELDIVRRLPGGGELPLGQLTAPALVGELGLVADVRRTADVRARSAVTVLRWERRLLEAACALQESAALEFTRRVVTGIADLDARLLARIAATVTPVAPVSTVVRPTAHEAPFDHAGFFALLKPCQALDPALREALLAATTARALAPDEALYAAGSAPDGIAIVLRGALELRPADGTATTLQILGPGALAGLPSALVGGAHAVACHAREQSIVRSLPQARFEALYAAGDRLGLALRAAVAGFVADSALALSNRLAQLIGLRRAQALLAQA